MLVKLCDLITKDRCNAEARAMAKKKYGNHDTTTTNGVNTTQEAPDATPKFNSWALLCTGTDRQYPNTNDVFHSHNYAIKPKGL